MRLYSDYLERGPTITGAESLSNLGDNSSGPADFLVFKLARDSEKRDILTGSNHIFESENFRLPFCAKNIVTWGVKYEKLNFRIW